MSSTPPTELRAVVAEWMAYGDDDLKAAELLRQKGHTRQASYLAQQAAEKYIKATLIRHQVKYDTRSHEIYDLRQSLNAADPALATGISCADVLSRYATARRYPGGGRPVRPDEVDQALALAKDVREQVRVALAPFLGSPPAQGAT